MLIKPGAVEIVYVKIEMRIAHDPVVKYPCLQNIFFGQCVTSLKVACFADSDQRRCCDEIAFFVAWHIGAQELDNCVNLTAAGKLRFYQICIFCAVNAGNVGHIAGDDSGERRTV